MKGTIAGYEIEAVSDSKLMDVYPYESQISIKWQKK